MKAVQMIAEGPPDVLRYVDVNMPVPGVGQVWVKAESISVNQFDAWVRSGTFPMKARSNHTSSDVCLCLKRRMHMP